jgi:bifunctional N-acetylglucosamine-1-phosphate-uridyltransferase/glucosamine-1-phosphate-acetyltransferase GlmU-like protein
MLQRLAPAACTNASERLKQENPCSLGHPKQIVLRKAIHLGHCNVRGHMEIQHPCTVPPPSIMPTGFLTSPHVVATSTQISQIFSHIGRQNGPFAALRPAPFVKS